MSMIILPMHLVLPRTEIDRLLDVPDFEGESVLVGEGFMSNLNNKLLKVSCPLDYRPRNSQNYCPLQPSIHLVQVSALVAYYCRDNDSYWVCKNRPTGEHGWIGSERFKTLVKEVL